MRQASVLRHLRKQAVDLVKSLLVHQNTAKADRLVERARRRAIRRSLALARLEYPSYRVVKAA